MDLHLVTIYIKIQHNENIIKLKSKKRVGTFRKLNLGTNI